MDSSDHATDATDGASDNDRNPFLLESGREPHQKQQNADEPNQRYFVSTKSVIRMIMYSIAVALACFVFYHYSSFNPLSGPYPETTSSNRSSSLLTSDSGDFSPPMNDLQVNSSPVARNSTLANNAEVNIPLPVEEENEEASLGNVLNEAAMANKTIIITAVNAAWTEPNSTFDTFLESFEIGIETKKLLNHLVVVSLDEKAYSRCLQLHKYCYSLVTEGVDFSGEKFYMTEDYLKMMWRRLEFLLTVLRMGYSFIFTDADIMWFRDPFLHFHTDTDFQIASDHYGGTPTSRRNRANCGFYFAKSNNQTIKFYEFWVKSRDQFPGINEQDIFNRISFGPFVQEIGLNIKFLDTAYYGGFCEPSKDLNLVCTMHANCCTGLNNKLHDLRMLIEDWKRYMALRMRSDEKTKLVQTWTVPRICG